MELKEYDNKDLQLVENISNNLNKSASNKRNDKFSEKKENVS